MGQECRTSRTRAEAKPTEIVLHGEVAQPNEQNLREQLIPCAAPMNPVMAVMVISPKKTVPGLCSRCKGLEGTQSEEEKAKIEVGVSISSFNCHNLHCSS
jgi:hypothetical protein